MACNIGLCPKNGCGYRCCNFDQGNYIVLFPVECEARVDMSHLEIIDKDYFGGRRAVCRAADKSSCDGKYKPVDCQIYPLWYNGNRMLKGSKCPLTHSDLLLEGFFNRVFSTVISFDITLIRGKVEMVGYEELQLS